MVKLICKITKNQSKPSGLIQIFVCLSSECDPYMATLNIHSAHCVGFYEDYQ